MADRVDRIDEPAFVVPTSGGSDDFVLRDEKLMSQVTFYIPPLQFLLRDGYGNMDFVDHLLTSVRTDKMTRKFIKSSPPQRKDMYQKLIETLRQNSDRPYQEDYDLLQEMNDNER